MRPCSGHTLPCPPAFQSPCRRGPRAAPLTLPESRLPTPRRTGVSHRADPRDAFLLAQSELRASRWLLPRRSSPMSLACANAGAVAPAATRTAPLLPGIASLPPSSAAWSRGTQAPALPAAWSRGTQAPAACSRCPAAAPRRLLELLEIRESSCLFFRCIFGLRSIIFPSTPPVSLEMRHRVTDLAHHMTFLRRVRPPDIVIRGMFGDFKAPYRNL